MDRKSYINCLDIYYITNGEIFKQHQKAFKRSIILTTTYDDIFNIKLSKEQFWIQPKLNMLNSDNDQSKPTTSNGNMNKFGYCNKYFFLFITLVILAMLAGVVLFSFCNIFNTSDDIYSSETHPVMNVDLCDQTNSYRGSSWFTPSTSQYSSCDVPIQISEIFIEGLEYPRGDTFNCLSKLECMSIIGLYFNAENENSKYNFFIDYNSNVYEARGWMCPYQSGQLWVGVIVDDYNFNGELDEINRILKHFNSDIASYAMKCGLFSIDSLKTNYLSITKYSESKIN